MDAKQSLRLWRLLVVVAVYVPCALMLHMLSWLGFLPTWFTPVWIAIGVFTNLVFFVLIKANLNLRFKDPSMAMAQMVAAIGAVAPILYYADAVRGGLLMLLLVVMFFGVLRLNTAQLLAMGAVASLAYALVIVVLTVHRSDQINLSIEWAQWATLTATLAVVCPLVGYMSNIRRRLSKSLLVIKEMAQHDALTGIFNRHHMGAMVDSEISRCQRGAKPFLLLIADIDHFKRINDTYGHLVGDQVLKAVACGIRGFLRTADYLARYGGEEFVLLVSVNNLDEAHMACERIRASVEQLHIPELQPHKLTISIGATFYRHDDTQASLLGRADTALYQAKHDGRNRVVLDTPGEPVNH